MLHFFVQHGYQIITMLCVSTIIGVSSHAVPISPCVSILTFHGSVCNPASCIGVCTTPNLDEEEIKGRFNQAFNILFSAKDRVLDECRTIQTALTDCTAIDEELANLLEEMELLAAVTRQCIEENSRNAQDQDEFNAKYNRLVEKYETAKGRVEVLQTQRAARLNEADSIGAFMFTLYEMETAAQEFDPKLWITAIDRATVHSDGTITFRFVGGMEITA